MGLSVDAQRVKPAHTVSKGPCELDRAGKLRRLACSWQRIGSFYESLVE